MMNKKVWIDGCGLPHPTHIEFVAWVILCKEGLSYVGKDLRHNYDIWKRANGELVATIV